MKRIIKLCAAVMAVLSICLTLAACDEASYDTSITGKGTSIRMTAVKEEIDSMKAEDFVTAEGVTDYVKISVKDYGDIIVVLRKDVAPKTVENFKSLVKDGFYTGTVFHRVVENFMVQGGGYVVEDGKLKEKDADVIKGEFTNNGFTNTLTHVRGVISMARLGESDKYTAEQNQVARDSANSQFFIMHQTTTTLNDDYASFGYVLAGMDVVDAIATCEVDDSDPNSPRPLTDVVIESITFVKPQ